MYWYVRFNSQIKHVPTILDKCKVGAQKTLPYKFH